MPIQPRNSSADDRPRTPTPEGIRPRFVGAVLLLPVAALAATAAAVAACSNDSSDQQTAPLDLGLPANINPPYYSDENLTIYEVQTPVALPVRKPTGSEISGAPPAHTPYAHYPYLQASDESIEVRYTLSNLDDQDYTVWLLVDPWNEFVRWSPGVTVVSDDVSRPNFGYDEGFVVPAQSRVQGTITSDDFLEIATKLASVQNLLASPEAKQAESPDAGTNGTFDPTALANHIFNPQNRSNEWDPNYSPWIPPVIAGVTGFDLGLRMYDTSGNIAVEITVDIVDNNGNRFVPAESKDPQIGVPPTVLSPPSARVP